jgi:hypothetical protein
VDCISSGHVLRKSDNPGDKDGITWIFQFWERNSMKDDEK